MSGTYRKQHKNLLNNMSISAWCWKRYFGTCCGV